MKHVENYYFNVINNNIVAIFNTRWICKYTYIIIFQCGLLNNMLLKISAIYNRGFKMDIDTETQT